MSYANGTTHYNLPQTVGTDKRDWFDTNTAFADVDAALHTASETASAAATDIVTLGGRVTDLETASGTQAQDIVDIKADILSQGGAITRLDGKIDGVKADALDMICAVDEGTAQVATVAVSEGEYFRYNDVLYIATANIAIGDTIVPNTNCTATNVATELQGIKADVEDVDTLARNGISSLSTRVGLLENNVFGTLVDLTQYSESTPYTLPSDGYVSCSAGGGALAKAIIADANGSNPIVTSVESTTSDVLANSLFVKKGFKVYGQTNSTPASVVYKPLQ